MSVDPEKGDKHEYWKRKQKRPVEAFTSSIKASVSRIHHTLHTLDQFSSSNVDDGGLKQPFLVRPAPTYYNWVRAGLVTMCIFPIVLFHCSNAMQIKIQSRKQWFFMFFPFNVAQTCRLSRVFSMCSFQRTPISPLRGIIPAPLTFGLSVPINAGIGSIGGMCLGGMLPNRDAIDMLVPDQQDQRENWYFISFYAYIYIYTYMYTVYI